MTPRTPTILLVSEQQTELAAILADGKLDITTSTFSEVPVKLKTEPIRLIILDTDIRIKSGLKELKKIKSKWPDIPIVFITSSSSEEIIIEAFRQGARDFFKKPVNTYQLKKTLGNLLRISNRDQEKRTPMVSRIQEVASPYDRATTDIPVNLLKIIAHMEEHLADEMDLELLAKKAGMSKFHFCRTFKKYLELSPIQFLTHLRMDKAKTLLGCSSRSVSDVAETVGFTDLSNFIKNFKKVIGLTPTGYRKSVRKSRRPAGSRRTSRA